jgi:hypothetical protein
LKNPQCSTRNCTPLPITNLSDDHPNRNRYASKRHTADGANTESSANCQNGAGTTLATARRHERTRRSSSREFQYRSQPRALTPRARGTVQTGPYRRPTADRQQPPVARACPRVHADRPLPALPAGTTSISLEFPRFSARSFRDPRVSPSRRSGRFYRRSARRSVTTRTSRKPGRAGSSGVTAVTPCATRASSMSVASSGSVSVKSPSGDPARS